jgi:hypothetical protein
MKAKILISALFLVVALGLTNCSKDCETKIATCNETPPTDELCDAFFNRWFYDKEKNSCEQIAYSGCSQKGFATERECEACKCD